MLWHFYGAQKCEAVLTCSETVSKPANSVTGYGTVSDIIINHGPVAQPGRALDFYWK